MTALEYANSRENVVVRMADVGCPTGMDIAWIPGETKLPFDLADVEGEVDKDGDFSATNLNVVGGAHGWQFHDWNANIVYAIWLRVDAVEWAKQYEDLMAE